MPSPRPVALVAAFSLASLAFPLATAVAQVTVQVQVVDPLVLTASAGPPEMETVPVGTVMGQSYVSSSDMSGSASSLYGATSAMGYPATWCELRARGSVSSVIPGSQSAHSHGAVLVTFTSSAPLSGVLVAKATVTSTGAYMVVAQATMEADFGDDGTIDFSSMSPPGSEYAVPCSLQPGQPFQVRVPHALDLIGDIGWTLEAKLTLRFIARAESLSAYGPTCTPTVLRHLDDGRSHMEIVTGAPTPDYLLAAVGFAQANMPLPTSNCPLLTTAEVVMGPIPVGAIVLPYNLLPPGLDLYVQLFGVDLTANTLVGSTGILYSGQ